MTELSLSARIRMVMLIAYEGFGVGIATIVGMMGGAVAIFFWPLIHPRGTIMLFFLFFLALLLWATTGAALVEAANALFVLLFLSVIGNLYRQSKMPDMEPYEWWWRRR